MKFDNSSIGELTSRQESSRRSNNQWTVHRSMRMRNTSMDTWNTKHDELKLAKNHISKLRNSQSIERDSQPSIDENKVSQSSMSVSQRPTMIMHMLSEPQSIRNIRHSHRKSCESSLSPILRKHRDLRQSFEDSQEVLLDKYGDPINQMP